MSIEGLAIERAVSADLREVHALEVRCFPSPWRREFFESELTNDGRYNLVARRNGVVAGYLFATWFADEMHINKIAVDATLRRQGIALAMMQRCLGFAAEHAVTSMWLEVRSSNDEAQQFYNFLGFEAEYIRNGYYPDGEAAVVMMREV
ncbi:MAG: [ribosomal protein S18]-alanine N-acetyltransferase [Thermoanaerobaculia bacterium]|jgi:ribosomal-protein-alanine N-acetyltransferase|nr:[ribosomal protein S18]-alanine N-acetyltransferase [Thermoanaerobaculia bacterium]